MLNGGFLALCFLSLFDINNHIAQPSNAEMDWCRVRGPGHQGNRKTWTSSARVFAGKWQVALSSGRRSIQPAAQTPLGVPPRPPQKSTVALNGRGFGVLLVTD